MWEKRVEPNSGTAHVAKCFPKKSPTQDFDKKTLVLQLLNTGRQQPVSNLFFSLVQSD